MPDTHSAPATVDFNRALDLANRHRHKAAEFRCMAKTSNNPEPLLDHALEFDARADCIILGMKDEGHD